MGKAEKERTSRRKVLKGLVELRNDHKFASVLIWVTNLGTSFFGTDGLKEKAKSAFNCSCVCSCGARNTSLWPDVLERDELNLLDTEGDFDPGMDILDYHDMEMPLEKLPMKLDNMCYNDLAKWLRPQIVRSRHERGYSGVKIVYKDMSWCPSFWPDNLCDWMEVSNFSHWKASEHTGPGDLTMVLKQAVENRLNEKGILPEEYVKINVDKKMEKRREK